MAGSCSRTGVLMEVHRFDVDDFLVATSWEWPSDLSPRSGENCSRADPNGVT